MTSCSLYASGLVPDVGGAVPTFSYRQDNHYGDYFGIQMTYLRGTSTCYQTGSLPQFTPVIQNEAARFSEECLFRTQGTTYTGIFCPDTPVTEIPNGLLTVSYVNWYRGQPTPIPFYATFGPSPAPKTVTASANALATSTSTVTATASAGFAATTTAYSASTTQTQTNTVVVTQTQITTNTNYVSSCSTSATSSKSSSSSTPSTPPSSSTKSSSSSGLSSSSSASTSSSNPAASSTSSATPSPSSTDAVSLSSSTTPSTTASPTSLSCPGDNGKNIDTAAGPFVVECYIDRSGGDLSTQYPARGFNGCIQLCADTQSCIDVSYSPNGPCYLKSAQGTPGSNKGIWGARLASATRSFVSGTPSATNTGAITTSTGPAATSAVVCPGSDGQTINTSAGTFVVECGIDRSGGDMSKSPVYPASYEGCIAACASRDGCLDVSYILNGACYLKSMVGTPKQDGNIIGGRLIGSRASATVSASASAGASGTGSPAQTVTVTTTLSDTAYQCTCTPASGLWKGAGPLSCPSSNGQTYTSDCGATYAIECSSDRYGDDIPGGSSSASTLNECIADCDRTDGCIDVSWVPGTSGTCYKKSSIAEIRRNDNVWGARQLTGCVASTKLKLHRKRVVREPAVPKKRASGGERGYYGPDYTYIQGITTSTKTSTATTVAYTTVTVTPPNSGTTTKTVYTTATKTATITNGATTTQTQQMTVTTCPAITKRAIS